MILKNGACQGRENAAEGMGQEQHPGRTATRKKQSANHYQRGKDGTLPMAGEIFIRADEVASVLGVSKPYAYKLIKKLNEKLEKTGCLTMAGRIDRKFFYEQFYGTREGKEI